MYIHEIWFHIKSELRNIWKMISQIPILKTTSIKAFLGSEEYLETPTFLHCVLYPVFFVFPVYS